MKPAETMNAVELRHAAAEAAARIGRSRTDARNRLTREQKIRLFTEGIWPEEPVNEVRTVVPDRIFAGPNYPRLGVVASAKVMNVAEQDGQFAIEVMLAAIEHKETRKRLSTKRTRHGTLLTVTDEAGRLVSILAEESEYHGSQYRRGGGFR